MTPPFGQQPAIEPLQPFALAPRSGERAREGRGAARLTQKRLKNAQIASPE